MHHVLYIPSVLRVYNKVVWTNWNFTYYLTNILTWLLVSAWLCVHETLLVQFTLNCTQVVKKKSRLIQMWHKKKQHIEIPQRVSVLSSLSWIFFTDSGPELRLSCQSKWQLTDEHNFLLQRAQQIYLPQRKKHINCISCCVFINLNCSQLELDWTALLIESHERAFMHRDQQSGQDILQIICSVCFSPDPIIYTQNTLNIRHVSRGTTLWYFCFFFLKAWC